MTRGGRAIVAALLAGAALAATRASGTRPGEVSIQLPESLQRLEGIRDTLRIAKLAGMNGVILIRARDRVLLHEVFGWADAEAKKEMTVETGFDIGSIVKTITAVALLKLEEQGRLSLSDTLGKFFPEAPADKRGIPLMLVASHRAGMRDVFGGDYDVVSREWLIGKAMAASLLYPPGTDEKYSNSGYSLLAIVIERVTGEPFETWVRREVVAPAGLSRIGYAQAGWKKDQLAVGYSKGKRWGTPLDRRWAADGPGWNLRGNGGMLATAADLCAWYEALFDGRILGPEALAKFYAGKARRSQTVGGSWAMGHAGGNDVFNSLQVSYADADVHLTFFTSTSDPRAEQVYRNFRWSFAEIAREAMADSAKSR